MEAQKLDYQLLEEPVPVQILVVEGVCSCKKMKSKVCEKQDQNLN
jgi:hypothetical protein